MFPLLLRGRVALGSCSECVQKVGRRKRTNSKKYNTSSAKTHQPVGAFEMPMALKEITRFVNLNEVQVNVFPSQKRDLNPPRMSKQQESPFMLDLLFLSVGQAYPYVLMEDLNILKQQVPRCSSKNCGSCFHVCYTAQIYKRHFDTCMKNEVVPIKLPDKTEIYLHYQNYLSRWFTPYVMSFDFESLVKPVATCSNTADRNSNDIKERHEFCRFFLAVFEHYNPVPVFFKRKGRLFVFIALSKTYKNLQKTTIKGCSYIVNTQDHHRFLPISARFVNEV